MLVCPLHIWGTCLRVLSNVFLHFEIRCFCNYKFIETPFRIKWKTKRFKAKRQVNKHRHLWTRKKCMWSRKVGRDNFILHYVSRQRQKHRYVGTIGEVFKFTALSKYYQWFSNKHYEFFLMFWVYCRICWRFFIEFENRMTIW